MDREDRRAFFAKKIPKYRRDPVLFFVEVLHFYPDPWQKDAARDLAENPRVTIRSGQGVGKTAFEAACLLWFLVCFPFPRIVATAPTRQQLNDVLWSEVAKWMEQSPLLKSMLKWTKTYIYMLGYEKRWFAVARTATKPENMQGFHEDNMLFIVDEASGVADPIMEAIQGTLSGGNNKLLMCGNPTRTSGVFYESHTANCGLYKYHKVSSLDSSRTNKENIEALIHKYGKESNVVKVRVLGEFPAQENDAFMSVMLVQSAIDNDGEMPLNRISFGVDVARFGDDETVIAVNAGGGISIPRIRHGQDLMATVGDVVLQYRDTVKAYPKYRGRIYVNIDDTGLGGGVTDRLREVKRELNLNRMVIVPVNFAARVPDEEAALYFNDIATYMWARLRDLIQEKAVKLPDDTEMLAQFSVRKYFMTSSGKIRLESKEEMKKRHIDSPDRADAIALSCYMEKSFSLGGLIS